MLESKYWNHIYAQNKKILQNKADVSIKEADLFIVARFISFLIDSMLNNHKAKLLLLMLCQI